MNWKCAIGATIGAPAILAAGFGLVWLTVKYDWMAVLFGILSTIAVLSAIWIGLYHSCKEYHENKQKKED